TSTLLPPRTTQRSDAVSRSRRVSASSTCTSCCKSTLIISLSLLSAGRSQRNQAIGVFTSEPAGPAETAGVVRTNAQFANVIGAQLQAQVVIERVAEGEAHQRAKRLIAIADRQKFVKAIPAELEHMNAEL